MPMDAPTSRRNLAVNDYLAANDCPAEDDYPAGSDVALHARAPVPTDARTGEGKHNPTRNAGVARLASCAACLLLVGLLLVGLPAFGRKLPAQEGVPVAASGASSPVVDTSLLRQIEHRVLPPPVVPGAAAHANLADYYFDANPELLSRFRRAREAYACQPPQQYQALTLISGTAGVGKTFIKGQIFDKDCPKSSVCKFDIRELYEQWLATATTELRPDLRDGDLVLNSLLAARSHKVPLLAKYLAAHEASFYVIDSLDEIHPDDYEWVLDQVEDFTFTSDREFIHVVVLGRPLAFRNYWLQRQAESTRDVQLKMLAPPRLRTTGDLRVSDWNYLSWKYKLLWQPEGNEPTAMSLETFNQWSDEGYPRSGQFASVGLDGDFRVITQSQGLLREWAGSQRVITGVLPNLAGNSLAREIAEQFYIAGRPFAERSVMNAYLDGWLQRDTRSDNRPSLAKPLHLDLYLRLLEGVAVDSLRKGQVDEQGFFPVRSDDQISLAYQDRLVAFPVTRILDRSGMKFMDPRQAGVARYRFEPVWFHRLLVEMSNDRLTQQGAVVGVPSADER